MEYKKYLKELYNTLKPQIEFVRETNNDIYWIYDEEQFYSKYCDMLFAFAKNDIKKGMTLSEELLNYKATSAKDKIAMSGMIVGNIIEHKDIVDQDFVLRVLLYVEKATSLPLPLTDMMWVRVNLAELNSIVGRKEVAITLFNQLKNDVEAEAYESKDFKKDMFISWIAMIDEKLEELEN